TGSGKSVAVNAMIVSMLLRSTPEEVRFLMVDPKMLELSVYEGIPHLLLPVVTDAKKAAMALRWGVEEMERRYQLLAECGVRNIAGFNKKVEKEGDGARKPHRAPKEKRVIDLTPPPSADGQTSAAQHDSGTIINSPGAENLLGMGDMLILPPGTSTLTRVHGPYVDEKEIHAVVEHWKAQGTPVYDPNILRPRAEDGDGLPVEDEGPDELYDQAVAALADMRFISI